MVLCLRPINNNGSDLNGHIWGFKWPKNGLVVATDCSHEYYKDGFVGYFKGTGNIWVLLDQFQIVKVNESEITKFENYVKFPKCEVIYTGTQKEATDILMKEYPNEIIIGASIIVGDNEIANTGDFGTSVAGINGIAKSGYKGKSIVGRSGTAIVGERGISIADEWGTAIAGDCGIAMAKSNGIVSAGKDGIISIEYWTYARPKIVKGHIGEKGLEANVKYRLDSKHRIIKEKDFIPTSFFY